MGVWVCGGKLWWWFLGEGGLDEGEWAGRGEVVVGR